MKKFAGYFTYLVSYILSFFTTALPVGAPEFEKWASNILALSKVPDNDSTRFALSVMVLHLDSDRGGIDRKPGQYFVRKLNRAAANECAHSVAQGLKEKQAATQKAQAEANMKQSIAQDSPANSGSGNVAVQQPQVQQAQN